MLTLTTIAVSCAYTRPAPHCCHALWGLKAFACSFACLWFADSRISWVLYCVPAFPYTLTNTPRTVDRAMARARNLRTRVKAQALSVCLCVFTYQPTVTYFLFNHLHLHTYIMCIYGRSIMFTYDFFLPYTIAARTAECLLGLFRQWSLALSSIHALNAFPLTQWVRKLFV